MLCTHLYDCHSRWCLWSAIFQQRVPRRALLRVVKIIIWDEAGMHHKYGMEAVNRALRDLMGAFDSRLRFYPFGGKVVAFGGDFRQVLPVVRRGTKRQILQVCALLSPYGRVSGSSSSRRTCVWRAWWLLAM